MRYYFAALVAVALLAVPWFAVNYPDQARHVAESVSGTFEASLAAVGALKR